MIKINSRGQMSVVCDKCGAKHPSARGLSLVAEWDDREYICGKCKRLLTKRAIDEGESAPLQAESTPEVLSIEEADTTSALRN